MHEVDRLSQRMAALARDLHERQGDHAATHQHVVAATLESIDGCDGVALSLLRRGALETVAATDGLGCESERLRDEVGEGPSLDAVRDQQEVHSTDVGLDDRWPTWGPKVAAAGARSVLVVRVYTHGQTLGTLTLCSRSHGAFNDEALEEARAVAAHVAVAVAAGQTIAHLALGLDSRTLIGQATGVLMERYGLDAAAAFAVLTRLSSSENIKLRVLAAEVVGGRAVGGS